MKNLDVYRLNFNREYPAYTDAKYNTICELVSALPTIDVASETLDSYGSDNLFSLIVPLIKIKNYKSQVPFPVTLLDAVKVIIEIKNTSPSSCVSIKHTKLFESLVNIEGFQLPTISAVFHFCHPGSYPIVDRNIAAACHLLSKDFSSELGGVSKSPSLPGPATSSKNKLAKYKAFISFLTKLKEMHNKQYKTNYGFRDLDKALMVYGVKEKREAAEKLL